MPKSITPDLVRAIRLYFVSGAGNIAADQVTDSKIESVLRQAGIKNRAEFEAFYEVESFEKFARTYEAIFISVPPVDYTEAINGNR